MKKKILFLHPNFPGQFKHIVKHFANSGHEVTFLCQTHYNRRIKNINLYTLKGKLGKEELDSLGLKAKDRSLKLAEQYLEAFKELSRNKWYPDIIISHSAWGCGVFAKQCWPKAHMISYVEWWFDINSSVYTYDAKNQYLGLSQGGAAMGHWPRNALIALELISANKLVSPTNWQKKQLPRLLQDNCTVIFDGIDNQKFFTLNHELSPNKEDYKITYGTRGMEPMRAFPQFIHSIPLLTREMPEITIEIAGNDEINYGGNAPKEGSWKKWAQQYLQKNNCQENVNWVGRLPEKEYINWLQNSDCHVYLTHPYVASWSLVEAIFSCRKIVASDVEPVREFYHADRMLLVDHRNTDSIANGILQQLRRKNEETTPLEADSLKIDTCLSGWDAVARCDVSTID